MFLILTALCMVVACAAFPFGWNSDDFRKICGPEANRFELGLCGIRWAYPLAIIGCVDGVVLATLAFILATRHVRLQPDPIYQNSLYKGKLIVDLRYLEQTVTSAFYLQVKSTTRTWRMPSAWQAPASQILISPAWICSPFCWWPRPMKTAFRSFRAITENVRPRAPMNVWISTEYRVNAAVVVLANCSRYQPVVLAPALGTVRFMYSMRSVARGNNVLASIRTARWLTQLSLSWESTLGQFELKIYAIRINLCVRECVCECACKMTIDWMIMVDLILFNLNSCV